MAMTDMSMSAEEAEEKMEKMMPSQDAPKYPYGLAISLTHDELEKMNVDYEDWAVGDTFHLHAMAKITSISRNESQDGENCRVEMQITSLDAESEDDENEQYDEETMHKAKMMRKAMRPLY